MSPIESLELVTSPRAQQQPVLGRKNSRCCIQGIKTLAETCTSIGKARDHGLEITVYWIVHRGQGPSHAGQLRSVFTLSQARCEVTVYLSCELLGKSCTYSQKSWDLCSESLTARITQNRCT
jgi:hypothetical protein